MATVRERTTQDLEGCAEALRAVHKASGYPVKGVADPIGFISSSQIIRAWIAEYQGRVVGHVCITKASPTAEDVVLWRQQSSDQIAALGRLFVHPEAQGLGIAGKLITAAVSHAAELGMRLVLYNLEKDTTARRMYEKFGWTFYGDFIFDWGEGTMKAYCYVSPALTKGT